MVNNMRLLLVVVGSLFFSLPSAILMMYPVAKRMTTASTAASLMVAVDLAISIDYSLFLLRRFHKEIAAGRPAQDAVLIMLQTSGRIVVVSGLTLLLCFLMMLCLPVPFIYSMGVASAMTVFSAMCVALTFTPVILLTCPKFFSSNRRWGLSSDGCCCKASARSPSVQPNEFTEQLRVTRQMSQEDRDTISEAIRAADADMIKTSKWAKFGFQLQKGAWIVVAILFIIALPIGVTSLPKFKYSVGVLPMMAANANSTNALVTLQNSFGAGSVFPTQLILVANAGLTDNEENRTRWSHDTCKELGRIAADVNNDMHGYQHEFTNKAFSGVMILDGTCQTGGLGKWNSAGHPYAATIVTISYPIDPFSPMGQQWITALRTAVNTPSARQLASWYVYGGGPVQMDAAGLTFARLPLMVSLMMCVVFVVIASAFRSVVAPLRAVFCLMWMLVLVFGAAVYIYQDGLLSFLNWKQLGQRDSGAMSWLSPAMAGAMMVGLGLDYDIFYSERVLEEWKNGYNEKEAAVRALAATANTISAAGFIMVLAFVALLVSETPVLNEIAFLLIFGVIIDCFITTKIIIPSVMFLLGRLNFWPRKQPSLAIR
jgi:uncharacterized membrane protein YdfJ with MMPL/SSD domain